MFLIGIFFTFIALVSAGHDSYTGNSVHGVKLRDVSEQALVNELQSSHGVDIWQYGYPGDVDAVIMLSPSNRDYVLDQLDQNGLEHYVDIPDVVEALATHDKQIKDWEALRSRSSRAALPFDHYPRYAEIDSYLESIAAQYPDLATVVNAGPSFEGRAIKYLKISTSNFTDSSKPVYFMTAMLHAREWVTTPVALFSIHRLVEDLREQDRDLLEDIDWIILPVANPDGYEYTHTDERLWRGTRSINEALDTTCRGVDGNRNFDINWNTTSGVSSNPCSQIYTGEEPFSEPETRIMRDIMHEYSDRIQLFLDIHSHGYYVLFGYGNSSLPSNPVGLFHVASAMGATIDSLKLPVAGFYRVGNSAILYQTSGASNDYALKVGIPLAYVLELPGYGYGFLVPPSYIAQINMETWEGIAVSARLARSYYRARL